MAEGCSNPRWYALQIRHERGRPSGRAEEQVIRGLNISGIEHFYPTYTERRNGRRDVAIKSLFPGYLFARFDASSEHRWHAVAIAGVAGIVSAGLIPAAIPDDQISAVRQLLASPMSVTPCPYVPLTRGDLVEIKLGPLAGQVGSVAEYRGKHQAVLVLSIEGMQRSIKTTVLREHIRPLPKKSNVVQMPSLAALPKAA